MFNLYLKNVHCKLGILPLILSPRRKAQNQVFRTLLSRVYSLFLFHRRFLSDHWLDRKILPFESTSSQISMIIRERCVTIIGERGNTQICEIQSTACLYWRAIERRRKTLSNACWHESCQVAFLGTIKEQGVVASSHSAAYIHFSLFPFDVRLSAYEVAVAFYFEHVTKCFFIARHRAQISPLYYDVLLILWLISFNHDLYKVYVP